MTVEKNHIYEEYSTSLSMFHYFVFNETKNTHTWVKLTFKLIVNIQVLFSVCLVIEEYKKSKVTGEKNTAQHIYYTSNVDLKI